MPDEQLKNLVDISLAESIQETMATVFSMSSVKLEPQQDHFDLAGSIGFVGRLEGVGMLLLQNRDACLLVSKMLRMDIAEMSSDVRDGVGEITNMVIGGLKTRLAERGYNFEIGIPTIIEGSNIDLKAGSDVVISRSEFTCGDIRFGVYFAFRIREEGEIIV